MVIWIWSFALLLLSVIIYCVSQRKWLFAIMMTLFLIGLLVMGEQYKNTITVARFELFDHYLLITYKDQKNKIIYYKDISELKHYCGGRSGLSGCSVAIYTKDERIQLPYLSGNDASEAQKLKVQIFAKMNQSH